MHENAKEFRNDELPYFVEDESQASSFERVLRPDFEGWIAHDPQMIVNTGSKHRRFFAKFQVESSSKDFAVVHYPWNAGIRNAKLYRIATDGTYESWPSERKGAPLWILRLNEGKNTFIFELEIRAPSSFKRSIKIASLKHFAFEGNKRYTTLAGIYGMAGSLIFFNLCMYLLYRKSYFIAYIIFSSSILFVLMTGSSHIPLLDARHWTIAFYLNAVATAVLSYTVLQLPLKMPKAARLLKISFLICSTAFVLVLAFELPQEVLYIADTGVYVVSIYAAVMQMLRGYRPAIFIAFGWTVLLLGFGSNYFSLYTDTSGTASTMAGYYAYVIENLLFAVAVAFRTRDSEMIAVKAKVHAFSQLEKVVYAHQVEEIKEGKDIENTMPTLPGEAAVICFDIIESSTLQHEKVKVFLRTLFRRCNEEMMLGYDGMHLKANAYRVKEMGDGFLCSVGYPFDSPTGYMAADAIALAHRFYRIFQEEVKNLDYRYPIRCAIGIAMGPLTGFYPESGTKEYDLYGHAIILATRYEGMRKALFQSMDPTSILIIQERVFLSLPGDVRKTFHEVSLNGEKLIVRDDPGASRLYYHDFEKQIEASQSPDGHLPLTSAS